MNKEINERELVLGILLEVTKEGQKSHIVIRSVLEKYQYLDKRERAFITRVSEGTIERMLELDYIIDQFSKVKTNKMKPVILNILRSAVYQLKYMDNVPASAACNEAVKLAVKKGFGSLRGFVNGVLRNISRNLDGIPYPSKEEPLRYLSVVYSMPDWIVRQWLSDYGYETTEAILKSMYEEHPTTVRVNSGQTDREALKEKLKREGVEVKEHPLSEEALLISGYDYLGSLESFRDGDYQIQDVSSIEVAKCAGIKPGDYVIDVCAAPGGKALHAAQLLAGTGHVEARDLTEQKVELIRDNIARMGFANIEAVQMDATCFDTDSVERADVLLADLPCSGLGVLAKKTDLKYNITERQQEELVELQRQILGVVKSYVKPGGTLVYSTCTVNKKENEENAAWFAEASPDFALEFEKQTLPSRESDGFYLAKFKRIR
ncbi:16S rRNA (cytosine(967)-C(5))-methyltransferase RsmB [Bariatricus massiliensis]|uniref:16S rRNA (cytosine(967)-C(5))-methyltransferase n=1 Tax=Bariatricus massiliensis TaxID=1745713 RepID=A0ABS8DE33_9FIRM|nr:16S rRNA (cytosine(967)-C(5))-methyltransferase RsmB [Bariatricus massiliensis]MCB7302784.1 16S rRNA (cytosine(967)-C(5))-methyltransferase RsmB [Bariatricus massiliensis]MCB7374000.1 16S rRNA (cytosine(967)-C(5))-methyltransferase RsmB [Bariatricus massiliensis]MCB7386670.1 16S rRNA (cytosine(967)-C(5))-methyltransferase RsmB [Bariatricus massiliensis]MCB7410832.1 16S rRNA (cytosine(967)-C(5))-methyltransferase RsmB [Bariatricus massiliensis]MCQ5251656.1 16S rRNA (cytosine(967)-C(5))-methy